MKRFIFISTIGVTCNRSLGLPFDEYSVLNPQNAYAKSKYLAEQGIFKIAENTGFGGCHHSPRSRLWR